VLVFGLVEGLSLKSVLGSYARNSFVVRLCRGSIKSYQTYLVRKVEIGFTETPISDLKNESAFRNCPN
jgi:hypothetical protein